MPRRKFPILFLLLSLTGSLFASDADSKPGPEPVRAHSSYFQDSGTQVDSLVDRIRFKISYSWMKAGEYFRLAFSAVPDSIPAKQRDAEARIQLKKEELINQGKAAVQSAASQTMQQISSKGSELKEELNKAGSEISEEARKEFRKNADQMFK